MEDAPATLPPSGGPTPERRPGRPRGSQNRTTVLIKEALAAVYRDLQESEGGGHKHFLAWAKDHPTEFYKMTLRLLPHEVDAHIDGRVIGAVVFKGLNG